MEKLNLPNFADAERRRLFAERLCRGNPSWTGEQCQQVMAAVKSDGPVGVRLDAADLPEDHPLRLNGVGCIAENVPMSSVGRADAPSYHYHHAIENPNPVDGRRNGLGLGEIGSAGVTVFPDGRAEFTTRPPSREEPQPMTRPVTIRADRATYHFDNGSPDDERGITGLVLEPGQPATFKADRVGIFGPNGEDLIERAMRDIAEVSGIQRYSPDPRAEVLDRPRTIAVDPNWTRAGQREQDDRTCRFWGVRPDPLAAMTCHRDTHTLERLPLPPAPPRKPLLIVPDGCALVIPDDVNPWEFMAGYDTSQSSRTGLIVNKGGYDMLNKMGDQQKAERAAERRTHAALTFEQPIQNRLGRMAK